ncbi:MAG TPA: hypothetical protein VIK14_03925 [Ignavibacteria bacterium]
MDNKKYHEVLDINFDDEKALVKCLFINKEGVIFAGLSNNFGIYKSFDNGVTWENSLNYKEKYKSSDNQFISKIIEDTSGILFACSSSSDQVLVSTNSGFSWEAYYDRYYKFNDVRGITVDNDGYVYIVLYNMGVYKSAIRSSDFINWNK